MKKKKVHLRQKHDWAWAIWDYLTENTLLFPHHKTEAKKLQLWNFSQFVFPIFLSLLLRFLVEGCRLCVFPRVATRSSRYRYLTNHFRRTKGGDDKFITSMLLRYRFKHFRSFVLKVLSCAQLRALWCKKLPTIAKFHEVWNINK